MERRVGPAFRAAGDVVGLIGETVPGLAGSIYAEMAGAAADDRPPAIDLQREADLQGFLLAAADARLLRSAQDVSGGGLAVALAECGIWSGLGADLELPVAAPPAVELFGEGPSRVVVSTAPDRWSSVAALAAEHRLPAVAWARSAATACGSAWSGRVQRVRPRSAAPASRTSSTNRSRSCATPGTQGCRAHSAKQSWLMHEAR